MAKYIDRSAAIERLTHLEVTKPTATMTEAKRALADMFPADVVSVVHGQWDGEGDGYADGKIVLDVWYCSECGHCIDDGTDDPCVLPNYFPNCGAKMDGVMQ